LQHRNTVISWRRNVSRAAQPFGDEIQNTLFARENFNTVPCEILNLRIEIQNTSITRHTTTSLALLKNLNTVPCEIQFQPIRIKVNKTGAAYSFIGPRFSLSGRVLAIDEVYSLSHSRKACYHGGVSMLRRRLQQASLQPQRRDRDEGC